MFKIFIIFHFGNSLSLRCEAEPLLTAFTVSVYCVLYLYTAPVDKAVSLEVWAEEGNSSMPKPSLKCWQNVGDGKRTTFPKRQAWGKVRHRVEKASWDRLDQSAIYIFYIYIFYTGWIKPHFLLSESCHTMSTSFNCIIWCLCFIGLPQYPVVVYVLL